MCHLRKDADTPFKKWIEHQRGLSLTNPGFRVGEVSATTMLFRADNDAYVR